ncbi:pyruvate dehydrogenase complex dehydrogenase (E1) component [Arthrobacter bambusae]|uniref:Pyruvate dehydrogenase complex dehydrogenase (E1) component n=1 Tax=Arthrobacter bambusae TaxID=1338426 RepID=A0ABV2P1S9_9MICC
MLEAMHRIGLPGGRSASFRLTTRPLDQGLASMPTDEMLVERRRWHAGNRAVSLGVRDFSQSSDLEDAYRIHGIDETSIVNAALNLMR